MASYLTLDKALVQDARKIGGAIRKEEYKAFLMVAVGLLEGDELFTSSVDWSSFGTEQQKNALVQLASTAGALIWELVKAAPTDADTVRDVLTSIKLGDEALVLAFTDCFQENRRRLLELKTSLSVESNRFKSLEWRLDVEMGRRGYIPLARPEFRLKMTLESPSAVEGDVTQDKVFLLAADSANMKKLHDGLADALEELGRAHCQRVIRYIT